MKKVLTLTLVLLLCTMVRAQTRKITGRVLSTANAALEGVTVQVKGSALSAATDADGNFVIAVTEQGSVVLVVSSVGFESKEVTVTGGSASFYCQNNFFNTGYSGADTVRRNYTVANKAVNTTTGATQSVTPFFYKYRDNQWTSGSNNSRVDWIVLRYADVLLMQSEAMNNIDPTDVNKFGGMNKVRARAGLTAVGQQLNLTNTPTASAFVDSLVADRARELCVEGERRWDLIRLGRFQQRMATLGITVDNNHLLMPIPQSEMQVNPNLKQNPGF